MSVHLIVLLGLIYSNIMIIAIVIILLMFSVIIVISYW